MHMSEYPNGECIKKGRRYPWQFWMTVLIRCVLCIIWMATHRTFFVSIQVLSLHWQISQTFFVMCSPMEPLKKFSLKQQPGFVAWWKWCWVTGKILPHDSLIWVFFLYWWLSCILMMKQQCRLKQAGFHQPLQQGKLLCGSKIINAGAIPALVWLLECPTGVATTCEEAALFLGNSASHCAELNDNVLQLGALTFLWVFNCFVVCYLSFQNPCHSTSSKGTSGDQRWENSNDPKNQ